MKDKISIIIPVYNVEQYIKRCLDSIINQTHKNLEVILVNDGSVDNSKSICEAYAKKDSRILLINQKNGGSSIARNTGLDNATGDIIAFIDSDDHVEKTMFASMFKCMHDHNLDVVDIEPIRANSQKVFDNELIIEDTITASKRVIKNTAFAVWRRIYKKDLVKGMRFIPGIIHQDVFYTIDVLNKASSIGHLNSPFYIYNNESVGIIRSKYTTAKISIGIRATEYIINNASDEPSVNKTVDNYVVFYYTDHYFLLSRNKHVDTDKKFRKKLKKEIIKRINKENIRLRSLLVILSPKWLMEIISSSNQKLK